VEGELPPSPAPHPQKQNLAVYTKELTHLGIYVTRQIEDLVRNLDNFCMTSVYTAISNLKAPQGNIDKAFEQMIVTFPQFRNAYDAILNPPLR
jgi:hypothetical protein